MWKQKIYRFAFGEIYFVCLFLQYFVYKSLVIKNKLYICNVILSLYSTSW